MRARSRDVVLPARRIACDEAIPLAREMFEALTFNWPVANMAARRRLVLRR
jgi:hypothetical protein